MKILHLITTLDRGGAEIFLYRLVRGMNQDVFKCIVVSMTDIGPVGKKIQAIGIPVYALNMVKGFPDARGMLPLKRIIQRFGPDILHCCMYHANLLGTLCSGKTGMIWNIFCSNMDFHKYGIVTWATVKLGARLSHKPRFAIVNSYAGKRSHQLLGYRPRKWEIVQGGFNTEVFKSDKGTRRKIRTELQIPEEALVIGLVARLDPMKDHRNFFNAAKTLLRTHPNVYFILAGKGVTSGNPVMMDLMNGLDNGRNIRLLGERDNIPQIDTAMDIATSSSCWGEGFPNSIGEAMSTGVPCVVTHVGDSKILVGNTGIVVPPEDPLALSQGWRTLIETKPATLALMGMKARRRIQTHFCESVVTKKYESLFQKAVSV